MSTEIARVVHPVTGQVVDLDGPIDQLAQFLADARDIDAAVKDAKRAVTDEVLRRADADAAWTIHLPGVKLSMPSPAPVEDWDELELREALLTLADEGVISVEAVDRAVEPVVTYKIRAAGVKALRKLGGRVAEAIDSRARETQRTRYVKVERS